MNMYMCIQGVAEVHGERNEHVHVYTGVAEVHGERNEHVYTGCC
jgi:hypothetical protein